MNIKELIPQREPFLFVDKVEAVEEDSINTSMKFHEELEFFKGHFPNTPIVPGVILNEHCFQSAAAHISVMEKGSFDNKLAVVSRIQSAKFKNLVRPNETIITKTTLLERVANAAFFKSISTNEAGQKVLILEFSVAVVDKV